MPYPTRSCVVIEPAVQFMGFLIQLEPFDYSAKIADRQKLVYEMYHEENDPRELPSPGINHDLTVKIDGVVKISVQKISHSDCLTDGKTVWLDFNKFSINLYKHDHEKKVDVLFRSLTTDVPIDWTPKLYAIFLCDLALRQSMWLCIYLDVKHDNSIESINGINILYHENISKLKYDANSSLALSFIKGGSN